MGYLAYSSETKNLGNTLLHFFKAIFTPKLKFIYSLDEIKPLFINDPDYGQEAAYLTTHSLPSDRIGLMGLMAHAEKRHVWNHIQTNPCKVVLGITQLALGIFLSPQTNNIIA